MICSLMCFAQLTRRQQQNLPASNDLFIVIQLNLRGALMCANVTFELVFFIIFFFVTR